MKRMVMLVAIVLMCTQLQAQEDQAGFSAETARIFRLKKAGQQALDEGKLDEAAKALREAVDAQLKLLGNDNPETLLTMGLLAEPLAKQECWEDAYKLREAILDAQRRLDGKATDEAVWNTVGAGLAWGVELFGGVDETPKDLACARELVRRLRERSQPFVDALTPDTALAMAAQWIEAWTECRSGNPQQAITVLEPGLKLFQDNAWGNMAMAFFCSQAGEKQLAQDWYAAGWEAYAAAANRDTEFDDVTKRVAAIIFGDQPPTAELEPDQCLPIYDRLIAAYPQVTPLYVRRGLHAARVCRAEAALADFRTGLELLPENAWNWYNLAIASLHAGHVEEYKKTLQGMYGKFAESTNPFDRHLLIIVWSLASNPEIDGSEMLEIANRPDRIDDSRIARLLYRSGKLDEMMTHLETKPDAILHAMAESKKGNKTETQRKIAEADSWVQSRRDPATNYFVANVPVMECMEVEIMWNEATKMIGATAVEPFLDKFAQLLVGDWTASGTITGEDDGGILKPGDKFSMVGSFQPGAGGKTIVGTQKLTVVDRPNVSSDCSVLIAWDPVDMVVRIVACWSDGAVEIGGLKSVEDYGFRGEYVLRLPNGRQTYAEISLEQGSKDQFAWVFKSGPNAGKCLSRWQRK